MSNDEDKQFPVVSEGTIGEATIQTVNARDLHAFLEVGKMFANWIKDRIDQYDFVEGADYVVFAETGKNSSGGRPAKEYHISLDMAKELSMVERNEKGKEARQYFIRMEKKAQQAIDPAAILESPAAMRGLLLSYTEKVIALESKVDAMQGDVAAHERLTKADGSLNVTEAAKNLGIRPKDLFDWLSHNGWTYKRANSQNWLGYQTKCNQGLLEHKTTTVLRADGSEKITEQVRVTAKGLSVLAKLIPPTAKLVA